MAIATEKRNPPEGEKKEKFCDNTITKKRKKSQENHLYESLSGVRQVCKLLTLKRLYAYNNRIIYVSNSYLSKSVGVTPRQVQNHLNDLEACGYIKRNTSKPIKTPQGFRTIRTIEVTEKGKKAILHYEFDLREYSFLISLKLRMRDPSYGLVSVKDNLREKKDKYSKKQEKKYEVLPATPPKFDPCVKSFVYLKKERRKRGLKFHDLEFLQKEVSEVASELGVEPDVTPKSLYFFEKKFGMTVLSEALTMCRRRVPETKLTSLGAYLGKLLESGAAEREIRFRRGREIASKELGQNLKYERYIKLGDSEISLDIAPEELTRWIRDKKGSPFSSSSRPSTQTSLVDGLKTSLNADPLPLKDVTSTNVATIETKPTYAPRNGFYGYTPNPTPKPIPKTVEKPKALYSPPPAPTQTTQSKKPTPKIEDLHPKLQAFAAENPTHFRLKGDHVYLYNDEFEHSFKFSDPESGWDAMISFAKRKYDALKNPG